MSTMNKRCPKCDSSMTLGAIVEKDQSMSTVTTWLEGPIVKGWFGLKFRGKKPIEIQTYRCNRCGYLESYAA